jgi:hypothetical protein
MRGKYTRTAARANIASGQYVTGTTLQEIKL